MKKWKKALGIVLAMSLCTALAGCGGQKEEYPVIGEKTEGALDILLKNNTGTDITSIAMKTDAEENYGENLFPKDFVLQNEGTAEWFFVPEKTEETKEQEATESEREFLLNPLYQVQITLADASVYEISSFGFEDIDKEAALCLEDGVMFLTYTSKESGESVSTKEQELAAKEQQEAAEKEAEEKAKEKKEAEEKAAAEKEAAEKEAEEKAQAAQPAKEQPASQPAPNQAPAPKQEPAPKQAPAEEIPAQSTEGCLTEGGGPVFND